MKNQNIITIILTILLAITSITATPLYYNIHLQSQNQEITIISIDIEFNQQNPENFYNPIINTQILELQDFNNKQLLKTNFTIPNIEISDNLNNKTNQFISGDTTTLNQTTFNIYIPYNKDAKQLKIYNQNNQELTTTSLAHFSTNPQAKNHIDKTIPTQQETTETQTKTKTQQPKQNYIWIILLIILIILIIILLITIRKKK
ncbi:hypothetical protein HOE04_00450 [archaeon]|nr:hypothetical protein [archaeon]